MMRTAIRAFLNDIFPTAMGFLLISPSAMSVSMSKQLFIPKVKAKKHDIVVKLIRNELTKVVFVNILGSFLRNGSNDKPRYALQSVTLKLLK